MSDINELAVQSAQLLAPFVPYLVKGGIEAGKSAAGKLGEIATEKGWEKAQSLWGKISKHEEVQKAAETVAQLPEDDDAQAALRLQIKLALTADEKLVEAFEKVLAARPGETRTVTAQGSRSVAIGGYARNNLIITGDHNEVER